MRSLFRLSAIRRGLLLFWALWLSVVTLTNVANALTALGSLPAGFVFSSGNWAWIGQTMNPLGVFLAYGPEAAHRVIFGNMILTVVALQLLPGGKVHGPS